jgi:hypothetical protein
MTDITRKDRLEQPQLIQSYVERKYFVSTIYRQCSAMAAPDIWYYETMVWEWNQEDGMGALVSQHDSGLCATWAVNHYARICRALVEGVDTGGENFDEYK